MDVPLTPRDMALSIGAVSEKTFFKGSADVIDPLVCGAVAVLCPMVFPFLPLFCIVVQVPCAVYEGEGPFGSKSCFLCG